VQFPAGRGLDSIAHYRRLQKQESSRMPTSRGRGECFDLGQHRRRCRGSSDAAQPLPAWLPPGEAGRDASIHSIGLPALACICGYIHSIHVRVKLQAEQPP
jgi:hypothetical protein